MIFLWPWLLLSLLRRRAVDARRRDRTWRYVMWSALAGLASGGLVACCLAVAVVSILEGDWWIAVIEVVVFALPALTLQLVRGLLAPRGWYRTAYVLGVLTPPRKDVSSYALCLAAWCARSTEGAAWIARRRDLRKPFGDADLAASALVAAAQGDRETARLLFRSVPMLVENHPIVRELCGEWLAVDAAERGAWRELDDDARIARWPATRLSYLLEGIAAVRLGEPGAPRANELWGRWFLAPRRRATYSLVVDALAHRASSGARRGADDIAPAAASASESTTAADIAAAADSASPSAPLPRAVSSLLAFTAAPAPTRESLAGAVRAWDAALADGATLAWLGQRALELDAPLGAVDRALREIAASVTDELARAAETAQLGAPASHGSVGDALARRLRHGRLDALEQAFLHWSQRRHDGIVRSAIDEWREFLALHAAYADAVAAGGLELRRLAFPHAFTEGNSVAAWLWNARKEYALSHAISRWLLSEALAVGDAEAIDLGHRNCALAIPTRLGNVRD